MISSASYKDKTFRFVTKRRRRDNNMKWSHTKVFPMKITTFAITFCLLVGRGVCLFCFHCSVMDSSKVGVLLDPDYHMHKQFIYTMLLGYCDTFRDRQDCHIIR